MARPFSVVVLALALREISAATPNAPKPPMGWMSWERYRCTVDCVTYPDGCIDENLYRNMTDRLVSDGYAAAGYNLVSIDDCWMSMERDKDGNQVADPGRFPSGMKAMGDYMHAAGIRFGIYSDMGTKTCEGYPGSEGFETQDANMYASWGVDFLKLDGCNNDQAGYIAGYPKMGSALKATGRPITYVSLDIIDGNIGFTLAALVHNLLCFSCALFSRYSCSWPAYLGNDEDAKPFDDFAAAGCDLWRNWDDVNNEWGSISTIVDHWGDYSAGSSVRSLSASAVDKLLWFVVVDGAYTVVTTDPFGQDTYRTLSLSR